MAGSILPHVDAALNATSTVLLLVGWRAIRRGQRLLHERCMLAATCASCAFLVCYVIYHTTHEPVRLRRDGALKVAYLALLVSHVVLAIVNVPLVARTLWLAHRKNWVAHRRWARITFPIWLYVSVTGVLVYLALYHVNPPPR